MERKLLLQAFVGVMRLVQALNRTAMRHTVQLCYGARVHLSRVAVSLCIVHLTFTLFPV
jgi:hypothetical protein